MDISNVISIAAFPIIAIIFVIIVRNLHKIISYLDKNTKNNDEIVHYKKKEYLLNVSERKLFNNLKSIVPSNYSIFPQMVLSNIVEVKDYEKKKFWTYQNKINRKTVDFVIFEKYYLKPVVVIEYDGKTHSRKDRKLRDEFVDNVLKSANIKIIHIKHKDNINLEELKSEMDKVLIFPNKNINQ